jgi:hypothetical protein
MAMRARFQDQKVCAIIERVYLVIQLASVAGSSIIQFGDIGIYYRKTGQGELSYSLTNTKRQRAATSICFVKSERLLVMGNTNCFFFFWISIFVQYMKDKQQQWY